MTPSTPALSAQRSHGDRLDALFDHYMHASNTLSAVRQAHIEKLGDSMCDRSLSAPLQSDLDALDELVDAAAQARELYTRCSLAFASALICEINAAVAKKLAVEPGKTRQRPGGRDDAAGRGRMARATIHAWVDDFLLVSDAQRTIEPK